MKTDDTAAIRAERDQARSDLAAERVRSAETARALEVARKALERISEQGVIERRGRKLICTSCKGEFWSVPVGSRCVGMGCMSADASRALATIRGIAGAGNDPPAEEGVDLSRCGGCGDRCGVWREDRALGPNDPCAWIREPGIWVFDCKNQDPRDEIPARSMAGEKEWAT